MRRHHNVYATDSNRHHAITAVLSSIATALVLVALPMVAAAEEPVTASWQPPVLDARCEQQVRDLGVWLDAVALAQPDHAPSGGTHSALAAHLAADCPEVGQVLDAVAQLPADGQAEALAAWMPQAVAQCGCELDINALKVVAYASASATTERKRAVIATRPSAL